MYGAGVRHPLRLCSPHRHSSIGGGDKKRKLFLTILSWKWHSSFARILFNGTQREDKKASSPAPAHTGGGCPDMAGVMAD